MSRYPTIPWPVAAFVAVADRPGGPVQLARREPSLAQTAYRMLVMTVGALARADPAAAAASRLPPRLLRLRGADGLGAVAAIRLDLEPCPLCVFQRVAVISTGIVFLIAAIHNPGRGGAIFYAVLTLFIAGIGAALAPWHVWIQAQPKEACRLRDGPQLHAGDAAALRGDPQGAEGQRRMRRAGMAVHGPRDPVVDVRLLHRDDRRGIRAGQSRRPSKRRKSGERRPRRSTPLRDPIVEKPVGARPERWSQVSYSIEPATRIAYQAHATRI